MSPSYESWNRALAIRFLQGQAPVPLYLYTDDSVLREVAGEAGVDASAAPDEFVRAVVGTLKAREPFAAWERNTRVSVPDGEFPPQLALLCFLVLVSVEREGTHFSYYPQLNRMLGRLPDAGPPPGFDPHVRLLFERFNAWLSSAGRTHGVPTAAPTEHFPNVGWPLSQALVRPTDRALLASVFHAVGLRPQQTVTAQQLGARVLPRIRLAGHSPSRTRLLELFERHERTFREVLMREYGAWDGSPTVAPGPRRVDARLCFEELSGEWWFLGPFVAGTEGRTWRLGSASGVVRAHSGFEAMPPEIWDLVGSGEIGSVEDGPALTSRSKRYRFFTVDTRAGGWAEVGQRETSSHQLVLVRSVDAPALRCLPEVDERLDAPPRFALFSVPPGVSLEGDVSREQTPSRPLLQGGLALHPSTNTYLLVPTGPPEVVGLGATVAVDGSRTPTVDGRLRLSDLQLGEGEHLLETEEWTARVRLMMSLEVGPAEYEGSWHHALPHVRRLRVPHDGGPIWLLGGDGQAAKRSVPSCEWATSLGLLVSEADVTPLLRNNWFEPQFVVIPRAVGSPWVVPVPEGLAEARTDEPAAGVDRSAAQGLLAELLVGCRPLEVQQSRAWKRTLAAFMRTVSR